MKVPDIKEDIKEIFKESSLRSTGIHRVFERHDPHQYKGKPSGIQYSKKVYIGENKYYLALYPERIKKYLVDFFNAVVRIYPEVRTKSPFTRIDLPVLEYHKKQLEKLLEMLTHAHTVLNITYRVKDSTGTYQSTREDYVNALSMLQPLAELYKNHRNDIEKDVTAIIKRFYKPGELFTRKDICHVLNYSKTHTSRIINLLEERQLIVRAGGYKNKGYKFMLTS